MAALLTLLKARGVLSFYFGLVLLDCVRMVDVVSEQKSVLGLACSRIGAAFDILVSV